MAEFYINHEYWFAVFQLVSAMLGMGATLKPSDFKEVVFEPFSVSVGTVIQLVLMPVLAFCFIALIDPAAGVAVGIALIAAIPGGTSSNIFTHYAQGNVALSISITAITTLACLMSTPLILGLLIASYMPPDFVMPTAKIMKEIAFNLLLPLTIGMVVLRVSPLYARYLSTWCIRGSVLGLILIFIGSSLAGRLDIDQFGLGNIAIVSLFIAAIVLLGCSVPRVLGLSCPDSTAIEMEVIIRSVNLGIMLKVSLFPVESGQDNTLGDMVLFSLLLYGAIQLLLGLVLIPLRKPAVPALRGQSN
jgi:BASS family bile acid:Na+ symporter